MFHPYLLILLPFKKKINTHFDKIKNFNFQSLCGKSAKVKPGLLFLQVCHWYLINPLADNDYGLVSRFILPCTSIPTAIVCVLFQEKQVIGFFFLRTASILNYIFNEKK